MGYDTSYKLSWKPLPEWRACTHHQIPGKKYCPECGRNQKSPDAEIWLVLDKPGYEEMYGAADGGNTCKWYECEEEMRIVSAQFPGVLFELTGNGEEPGDIWIAYFLDGKMQKERARITYGEFDKEKLK